MKLCRIRDFNREVGQNFSVVKKNPWALTLKKLMIGKGNTWSGGGYGLIACDISYLVMQLILPNVYFSH